MKANSAFQNLGNFGKIFNKNFSILCILVVLSEMYDEKILQNGTWFIEEFITYQGNLFGRL